MSRHPARPPADPSCRAYACQTELQGLAVSRTVLLPLDATLHDLHHAIQGTFGWWDVHLHRFVEWNGEVPYFYKDLHLPDADPTRAMDERGYDLNLLASRLNHPMLGFDLQPQGAALFDEYDFGDRWICQVRIRRLSVPTRELLTCSAAQGVAPCEDSGGVDGYLEKVALYHKRHAPTRQWFRMMNHRPTTRVTPHRVTRQWQDYVVGRVGPRPDEQSGEEA